MIKFLMLRLRLWVLLCLCLFTTALTAGELKFTASLTGAQLALNNSVAVKEHFYDYMQNNSDW